jgi:hypothetical protein
MPHTSRIRHLSLRSFLLIGSLTLGALAICATLLFIYQSTPDQTPSTGVTFQVHIGFDGRYKDGSWVPVYISLSNTGTDFSGTLSISPPDSLIASQWPSTLYQTTIILPAGAQKQVTLYIPLKASIPDPSTTLAVQLFDTHNHLILTQSAFAYPLNPQDIFVGLLADQPANFNALTNVPLPNHSAILATEPLNASTFPTEAAALDNFDVLILDGFTSSTLSADQLSALQAWIQRGGALIEIGGPAWQRSLTSLPHNLLPVSLTNTSLLSRRIASFSLNDDPLPTGQTSRAQSPLTPILINTATLAHTPISTLNTVILSTGTIPLLVQRQQGQGTIYYLGFDPTLEPLASWSGIQSFWQDLLLRTVGDQFLTPNTGAPILPASGIFSSMNPSLPLIGMGMESLLSSMLPHTLSLPWSLITITLTYLLILGPLRFLFTRITKKRWSWRIIISSIIIFSSLSYGLALQEKNNAIRSNSISVLQINQDGTSAHMTTYTGIFLPDQGTFHITWPGTELTQMLPTPASNPASVAQQVNIMSNTHATTVNMHGDQTWTMHTFISEQEQQVRGTVIPHLTFDHTSIVGTISNTSPYSLSDSYILMARSYIHSGPLMAHQTRTIHISLKTINDPLATLADQIAADAGLPSAYSLNANFIPTQTLSDLHLETLAALSGELSSFACGLDICMAKSGKAQHLFGNPIMFSSAGSDPLLLANASATLIGWSEQQPSIHVNGSPSNGSNETLLQIPLTMHFPDTSYVPPHTLTARLIDIQGKPVQSQYGIYLLTTGSMTFELPLPPNMNIQTAPLTISLLPYPPSGIYMLDNPGVRLIANAQHLHVSLYNWQTARWDTTAFNQYTLSIQQPAYIGPNQRILFKLTNHNASEGTFVLGTPIISA